jgi:predicted small lipoprotein YifL
MRLTIRLVTAAVALATLVSLTGCGDGGQEIKPADAGGVQAQPLPAPKSPADGGDAPPKNKPGGAVGAQ